MNAIGHRFIQAVKTPFQQASQKLEALSPATKDHLITWIPVLAPLGTCAATSAMTAYHFRHSGLPLAEQNFNIAQEDARQLVSGTLGLVASGLGIAIGRATADTRSAKTIQGVIGAALMNFIVYSFVRPKLNTEVILRWLYPDRASSQQVASRTPSFSALFSQHHQPLPPSWYL